jgi:hypothetical protein
LDKLLSQGLHVRGHHIPLISGFWININICGRHVLPGSHWGLLHCRRSTLTNDATKVGQCLGLPLLGSSSIIVICLFHSTSTTALRAILLVPLLVFADLLQRKFQPGVRQQQRTDEEANQHVEKPDRDVDMENAHQDTDDEDSHHYFDYIFDLSGGIINCGGLITVVFGHYMVGPANAVGFLFFYTIAPGLYLMMITTVRTLALTRHVRFKVMTIFDSSPLAKDTIAKFRPDIHTSLWCHGSPIFLKLQGRVFRHFIKTMKKLCTAQT